jgi:hypothetical protein
MMFGKWLLRRTFQPKENVTGEGAENNQLHNLCSSPNIIIKPRRMKLSRLLSRMREKVNAQIFWFGET